LRSIASLPAGAGGYSGADMGFFGAVVCGEFPTGFGEVPDMEDNAPNSNSINYHNNLDLIYQYSESVLKAVEDDTNSINIKLGIVLALDVGLGKLAVDLPGQTLIVDNYPCYSCLLLKFLVFMLLLLSTWFSIQGLLTASSGYIARPKALLDKWYYADREHCKLFILKGLVQAVEGGALNRERKAKQLNMSIRFLAGTLALLVLLALGFLISSLNSSL